MVSYDAQGPRTTGTGAGTGGDRDVSGCGYGWRPSGNVREEDMGDLVTTDRPTRAGDDHVGVDGFPLRFGSESRLLEDPLSFSDPSNSPRRRVGTTET